MTIAGIGAGISELTALAATSELAPTAKRGKYVAVLVFTIIPFCPSVLWSQLIAYHAGWRWCGLLCGVWVSIGFFLTLFFYFPPPRPNSLGLSRREILSQVDFVGGLLSIGGMVLFMAGMQWGGYQVSLPPDRIHSSLRKTVQMAFGSRTGASSYWSSNAHRLRLLGSLRS
jgi:hypothetical protein